MATESSSAEETLLAPLRAAGALALQRHQEQRSGAHRHYFDAPARPTAAYLRTALACARIMARLAKRHPTLWREALSLIDAVVGAATDAEQWRTSLNENSAPYIMLLIAAEALRLQILDAQAEATTPEPASDPLPPEPAPITLTGLETLSPASSFILDHSDVIVAADTTPCDQSLLSAPG